jgi:prepilin-type N-terminal cleavage/methylation domain-containing protein
MTALAEGLGMHSSFSTLGRQPVHGKRPGYTLLELVLVVAVLGIVAAISYPVVTSMYAYEKVKSAADIVRANLAKARSHAMSEGRPYKMAVVHNKGSYRIAPDSPSFWSGSGSGDQGSGGSGPLVATEKLPYGIRFSTGGAAAAASSSMDDDTSADSEDWESWSSTATFLPDGTATEDTDITLQVSGSRPVVLKLRAMTGAVTLEQ